MDPPVGGCEDGAVVITEGDRTPLGQSAVIRRISPNICSDVRSAGSRCLSSDTPVLLGLAIERNLARPRRKQPEPARLGLY